MNKTLLIFILAFLLLGLVSATPYYGYSKENLIVVKEFEKSYLINDYSSDQEYSHHPYNYQYDNNDKRYPVYDYRHGYTYRTSDEFKKSYRKKIILNREIKDYKRNRKNQEDKEDEKRYYYQYQPSKREYVKLECYNSSPKGIWIYIRCPSTFSLN